MRALLTLRGRNRDGSISLVIPPTAAKRLEKRGGIGVAGGLVSHAVQRGLQLLALRIEKSELADAAPVVALRGDAIGAVSMLGSFTSIVQGLGVVFDGAQSVGHFTEGLEHGLLIHAAIFARTPI